jgi:beta-lactamase superfamily II metal-dependent hydrolase
MMSKPWLLATVFSLSIAASAQAGKPLRVVAIDVEGGSATLYVTPQGHSLLIDAGWPAGLGGRRPAAGAAPPPTPSSAERIATAVKAAGLNHIDDLLISHYHTDHVGGAVELMGLIPVGTVIDHGPNREEIPAGAGPRAVTYAPATLYPRYLAAIGGRPHRVMKPGDMLRIDDLTVTAVDSDRAVLSTPLASGGESGSGCASATTNDDLGGEENPRSLGVLIRWGRTRILSLADTTWNVENSLACPHDMIGPVDMMFADNHGSDNANSPALVNTVRPRVVIFGNGPTKGAGARSLATAMASPRVQGVWQIHLAEQHPTENAPAEHIANLPGSTDAMNSIPIAVFKSGAIRVTNLRTGQTVIYPPR